MVPRHKLIVERILQIEDASWLTISIGAAECVMAAWIISGNFPKLNTWTQIVVILFMNVLEFFLAQDLLLWGKLNALFAILFCGLIALNGFYLKTSKNIL